MSFIYDGIEYTDDDLGIAQVASPTDETTTSLEGYVQHFIFRREETGYGVFVLQTDKGEITCVGNCGDVSEGENLILSGEFVQNPVYGRQFEIKTYQVETPTDAISIERYLGSGAVKGVGPKLAATIVKEFGDDTLRVIEEEPELLARIKGISLRKANEIALQISEKKDLRDAMLFLSQYNISQRLAVKIYETYGIELYSVLRTNPYKLAEDVSGIGFQTADKIAYIAGVEPDSDYRIRSGILYALQLSVQAGHSYLPLAELFLQASKVLNLNVEALEGKIDALVVERKIILKNQNAYLASYYYAELNCARELHEKSLIIEKLNASRRAKVSDELSSLARELGMEVDELQLEAAISCVENGVFILSGGPGTGKTTTTRLIIEYFASKKMNILLAAPTGRAAKRMSEATGYEATTIHRMLGVGGNSEEDNSQAFFQKNEDDPLEADVVVIDEMSMVDLMLFQALLRAIVPGTRLILVGDMDQLPSVGAGQVLRDLIDSNAYATIVLKRIFRQAMDSDIVVNAHNINEGQQIRLDTNSKDFLFLERNDIRIIRDTMVWMMKEKLPKYVGADINEVQVLTPMRKGALGCIELNAYLQGQLNPPAYGKKEHIVGDSIFREGDKVMQVKNNYKLEWEIPGLYGIVIDHGLGVFNGDMGRILKVDEAAGVVKVEFDDKRIVSYPMSGLDELELAYAVTIHKSQGSEYPAVIMPLLEVPALLSYRNLLYTGITRAKSCVVILGKSETVRGMIDNAGEHKRYSSLKERIIEWEDM